MPTTASGVINTTRQVGGSIGLAALATVAADRSNQLLATGQTQVNAALTSGYSRAFAGSVLLLLGASAVATIIPSVVRRREDAEQAPVAETNAPDAMVAVPETVDEDAR